MTREEAIWYLQPIADSASLPRYAEALNMAIAALKEQEGKDTNAPTKWISVEDRLPEENGYYLCWRNKEVKMLFWEDNLWLRQHNLLSTVNFVTHWMPLPEPPEVKA